MGIGNSVGEQGERYKLRYGIEQRLIQVDTVHCDLDG